MTDPTNLPNFNEPSPDFPPPADEHPLRGRVLDILTDLGYQPNIDDDGDVSFTVDTNQFYVKITPQEGLDLMRVYGQWRVMPEVTAPLEERLHNVNELNLNIHVLKSAIAAGFLVMICDHMVFHGEPSEAVTFRLRASVDLIMQAVPAWHEHMMADREGPWTSQIDPEGGMPGAEQGQPEGM